jgi:hypothetical protein
MREYYSVCSNIFVPKLHLLALVAINFVPNRHLLAALPLFYLNSTRSSSIITLPIRHLHLKLANASDPN